MHSDPETAISYCNRERERPPGGVLQLQRGTWKDCGEAQLIRKKRLYPIFVLSHKITYKYDDTNWC